MTRQGPVGWRPGVEEQLSCYVYLLIDPRTDEAFYVGKGVGSRCFSHLAEATRTKRDEVGEYTKLDLIRSITAEGLDVRVDVLRHGLQEHEALLVEAAAIDLLGIADLTNRVTGHGGRELGRIGVEDINARYGATPIKVHPSDRLLLIRVARRFERGIDPGDLYDATRRWWRVGEYRRTLGSSRAPDLAAAVWQGVVRAVYRIEGWEQPSAADIAEDPIRQGRWASGATGTRQPKTGISSPTSPSSCPKRHRTRCAT